MFGSDLASRACANRASYVTELYAVKGTSLSITSAIFYWRTIHCVCSFVQNQMGFLHYTWGIFTISEQHEQALDLSSKAWENSIQISNI